MSRTSIPLSRSSEYGERIVSDVLRGMMHNFKVDLRDPTPYLNRMDEYSQSDEFRNRLKRIVEDPNAVDIMIMYYDYDHVDYDIFIMDHPDSKGYEASVRMLRKYHMIPDSD